MIIKTLELVNYRNYRKIKIKLNDKVNLFIGSNAQGKTNFLESIYYISTGRTFRDNKDIELINWEEDFFHIKAEIIKKNIQRYYVIEIYLDKRGRKQIKINGIKYKKISELFGFLQVVIFSPDDLNIIKGGPSDRRKYIDIEMCQLIPGYYNILSSYYKVLKQRNKLLKEVKDNKHNKELLEIWDEKLIEFGSKIITNRINFLKKLVPLARLNQSKITSDKEKLNITYSSTVIKNVLDEEKKIKDIFFNLIQQNKKQEINKGVTLFGPHRDDLIFYINGKELKIFGSQGQQRTAILSLKLAELELFFKLNEDYPLLLLDDVMSELDDKRRNFLIKVIKNNQIQTFITGANKDLIDENIEKKEIFYVNKGEIEGPGRN